MSGDIGVVIAGALGRYGVGTSQKAFRALGPLFANVTIEERHEDDLEITDHPVETGATITDHAFKRPAELIVHAAWSNSPNQIPGFLGGVAGALVNLQSGQLQNQLTTAAARGIGGSAIGNLAVAQLNSTVSNQVNAFFAAENSGAGVGTNTVQDIYQQLLSLQSSATLMTIYTGKRKYNNMLLKQIRVTTDVKTENSLDAVLTFRQVILVDTATIIVPADPTSQADPSKTAATANFGTQQIAAVTPSPQLTGLFQSILPLGF